MRLISYHTCTHTHAHTHTHRVRKQIGAELAAIRRQGNGPIGGSDAHGPGLAHGPGGSEGFSLRGAGIVSALDTVALLRSLWGPAGGAVERKVRPASLVEQLRAAAGVGAPGTPHSATPYAPLPLPPLPPPPCRYRQGDIYAHVLGA